ncbi:hypothetical protein C6965_01505 [Escherichia coli]|nr:hypothetical protein [Escherichia coli]PSG04978.1 hypothetical protein C6963_27270 [Escherichia coli]PSG35649.1 hypothetical protein C6965_01505 [Escherichia coli]HAG9039129.1 hypothetical protein [Escherichia coli]HAH5947256.1 hypothetical protein [Escherichia coli]
MFHTIVSIKNDGHYFCRAGGNRPDGLNEPVTKKGDFTVLVIQEVTPRLVLRSGNAVVGLENSGFGKVHAADGSTVSRQVERVEKPESN